jgi:hypothetical protein
MNKLRLIVLITGLLFLSMGLYRMLFQSERGALYANVVLMVIGVMLVLAVRRK